MGEPRAVGDLVHVEKFFARNLGGLTRARTRAGPAREGRSRTPSMYADEKSDEVVVPRKRSNRRSAKAATCSSPGVHRSRRLWWAATRRAVAAAKPFLPVARHWAPPCRRRPNCASPPAASL